MFSADPGIKKNGIHCMKYLYEILKKSPQKSKKKLHMETFAKFKKISQFDIIYLSKNISIPMA